MKKAKEVGREREMEREMQVRRVVPSSYAILCLLSASATSVWVVMA